MKVWTFLLLLVVVGGMVMSGCNETQQQPQKPLPAEWKKNFGGGKLSRLALRNTQLVNFHHQALREVAQRLQALEAKVDPNNPSETDPNN